jgi:hypothetical protein
MKMNKEHFWKPDHIIWNRYKYVMDNIKWLAYAVTTF